ncbi:MAG TPA: N(G),N(G)-dimethylarginine dimethylaminohydrolase [Thermoleophilaceae bacterium]|nr:N(G),N(G)-dimethylarginine dimethylaminohydrolase [Thermoleophilaceae bacterium]
MTAGTAIVRRPSPRLAEGIVTHIERASVDAGRAAEQWEGYGEALRNHGWRIEEVPTADEHPDGVFVEDAAVVLCGVAVLTRPGAPQRRGEVESVARTLGRLGFEPRRITDPGELDGGDVMSAGDTVYVGVGGRTNAEGVRQLGEALAPAGMTAVSVPVSRVLHLKSAATVLPGGTVIGHPDALDDPAIFPRFVAAPEEPGAHVVRLGDDAVLMATGAPRTEALLRQRGLRPVTVDIGEFEKLEGCVTCLSVRLRPGP